MNKKNRECKSKEQIPDLYGKYLNVCMYVCVCINGVPGDAKYTVLTIFCFKKFN